MLDWLFDRGLDDLWLSTDPGTRAERFYRSAGWKAAGVEHNGEIRFEMSRRTWGDLRIQGAQRRAID